MRDARDSPRTFRAPGRVNLIGGQVDYHEGFVVAMAIDRDVRVTATARDDAFVSARSREVAGDVVVRADGSDEPSDVSPAWGRLVGGVVRTLAELGRPAVGADLAIASSVPMAAGVSSSAAFEVAVAHALADAARMSIAPRDLMLAAQRAEHIATGVPCGIQDQMSSIFGVAGHALLVDCRSFDVDPVPLPPSVAVVVVHSGVERALEHTPYAARRRESMAVAERLGVRALRDARPDQVADDPLGRHAVGEIERVLAFAETMRAGDMVEAGRLMLASHRSSREDMQVSTPELDVLVDALTAAGAFGARLTGAGFGGCVVALAPAGDARVIEAEARETYAHRTGRRPRSWIVRAAAGGGPVESA